MDRVRDVLEYALPGDLDLAGWDLPKALGLFRKSNPALIEWLHAKEFYAKHDGFLQELRELMPHYVSLRAGFHHYMSMATSNYRTNLDAEVVNLKKYFYVLRPLFSAQFILTEQSWPPLNFEALVEAIKPSAEVIAALRQLLLRKKQAGEMERGPRDEVLHAEIARLRESLRLVDLPERPKTTVEPLNALLRSYAFQN